MPLNYRLAYIADLEATFTPFFKLLLDNEDVLFRTEMIRVVTSVVALCRRGGAPEFSPGDL